MQNFSSTHIFFLLQTKIESDANLKHTQIYFEIAVDSVHWRYFFSFRRKPQLFLPIWMYFMVKNAIHLIQFPNSVHSSNSCLFKVPHSHWVLSSEITFVQSQYLFVRDRASYKNLELHSSAPYMQKCLHAFKVFL